VEALEVSFIIPAYNEEKYISNVIESISQNVTDITFEILVIDNGSSDATKDIALTYIDKVHSFDRMTISAARNIGVSKSKGKLLVFLDADVRITPEWHTTLGANIRRLSDELVISGARYIVRENPSSIEKNWFEPLSKRSVSYINAGNLILSRSAFDFIGGFDVTLETGEDYEFCHRAKSMGVDLKQENGFRAIHDGYPSDIKNFWKREVWHGKGDCKDIKIFFNSKVALISLFLGGLHYLLIIGLLVNSHQLIMVSVVLITLVSLLLSFKIFYGTTIRLMFFNVYLCYLYILAMHFSLYDVFFSKKLKTKN
jgi:glycosyltransferase involved in cell wall biosynthesis